MALLAGFFLILALPGTALADDATTAGPATATPGKATKTAGAAKITVNIPYSGDADGDNSALIQWDEDGGDWSSLLGSQALAHSPNPCSFDITGLDNGTTYQIRVTITDPDGGSNLVQTLTGLKPYNLLLHNAVSTGSGKWSGNWGLADAGSRYGEITCSTCHATSTGNIKRVKETITAANSPTHNFPGSAVEFLDARDGTSHFGDDSGGRTASNRICEVCHSATAYHRYDAGTNPGGTTHYNGRDCMECHAHNNAFKANCTGCHGDSATGVMWPDSAPADSYADRAGAHLTHVEKIGAAINSAGGGPGIATLADKNASCIYCHPQPGGTNRDGAGHTDNTLNSPASVADVFNDGINLPGEGNFRYIDGSTDSDGLYNPNIKRCSNIDCHSNGDFTWTWYEDATAPGRITDLAGATGTEVGTVGLTWTAPNNDGATGPVAYGYEVRYRTDGAVTDANWAGSTIAGGAPGAVRTYIGDSINQTMTVYGLTPGTTYYFAVKAFDETMTNFAEASNSVSA
ncbi:MAG: cytochrome c3 family protein, partial [Trichloromonas sp.]|nr:cytochrome c3 family protein [Trichloromonas sp.]